MKLFNVTTQQVISEHIIVADTFYTRCKGLLGRDSLPEDSVLWIKNCPSIHTFFMKFSLDVVFHDNAMQAVRVIENIKPWRMTLPFQFNQSGCFEFSKQNISNKIKKGDLINVLP